MNMEGGVPDAIKKILVVDDNVSTLELLTVVLEKEKFQVVTAFDGWSGLEKARKEKPDLILLDVYMPEMDGETALRALKGMDSTKHISVIMLTAKGEKDTVLVTKFAGISDFVVKPFDNDVLLKKIRKTLGVQEPAAPDTGNAAVAATPSPASAEELFQKTVPETAPQEPAAMGEDKKPKDSAAEDAVDPALQEKILKTQYCAKEDHKMSELQPYEQVMGTDMKEGMILAMPILYTNKRPFLNTGTVLTQKHIEKIREKIGELVFPVSVRKNEQQNG